jgi:anthranilate/para-aminobenzoate synthase component I
MFISKKITWHDPLNLVQKVIANYQQNLVFLYSALWQKVDNSKSFLALFPIETMMLNNFSQLDVLLQNNQKTWFGYCSYENIIDLEKISLSNNFYIKTTPFFWQNFGLVLEFDHSKKKLLIKYQHQKYLDFILECCKSDLPPSLKNLPKAQNIITNLNKKQYLQAILDIQQKILAGDLFQTNLTQKFYGLLNQNINHWIG